MAHDSLSPFDAEMRPSWLIQRLNRPYPKREGESALAESVDNVFAFGGGLRNGGLSPEAMNLLREHFSFDYMGAAEFEWGRVPAALQRLGQFAEKGDLHHRTITIEHKAVAPHYREDKKAPAPEGSTEVYLLGHGKHMEQIEDVVSEIALKGYGFATKENTRLSETLRPGPDGPADWNRVGGWLEIINGYMFFVDRTMFEGVAALFSVDVTQP